jgi:hypothetical protein
MAIGGLGGANRFGSHRRMVPLTLLWCPSVRLGVAPAWLRTDPGPRDLPVALSFVAGATAVT